MARSAQTTRPKPRYAFSSTDVVTASIKDHRGLATTLAWRPDPYSQEGDGYAGLPQFPWQVYILDNVSRHVEASEIAAAFQVCIYENGNISDGDCLYHFQVYSWELSNVFDCIAQQHREIHNRRHHAVWPSMLHTERAHDAYFYMHLVVIDRLDWLQEGFLSLQYDYRAFDKTIALVNDPGINKLERMPVTAKRLREFHFLNEHFREVFHAHGHSWTCEEMRISNADRMERIVDTQLPSSSKDDDMTGAVDIQAVRNLHLDPLTDQDLNKCEHARNVLELCMIPKDSVSDGLAYLGVHRYFDHAGWTVTSVWNRAISFERPSFSFTIYLSESHAGIPTKALFSRFNQQLMPTTPWALDIVRGVRDISEAFNHFDWEAERRHAHGQARRSRAYRIVLDRICGRVLPEELLVQILHLLDPPLIPDYATFPFRPFHNVFLFWGRDIDHAFPQLIYYKPFFSKKSHLDLHTEAYNPQMRYFGRQEFRREDQELFVIAPSGWTEIVAELHTLWSLSAPRYSLPESDVPILSVRIEIDNVISLDSSFENVPNIAFYLTLHSHRPILIHYSQPFYPSLLEEGFDFLDVGTNKRTPLMPYRNWINLAYNESWDGLLAKLSETGLRSDDRQMSIATLDEKRLILRPGQTINLTGATGGPFLIDTIPWTRVQWWTDRFNLLMLRNGRSYQIRMTGGLALRRWTFADGKVRDGPFNLPLVPIRIENEPVFKVELSGLNYEV